MKGQLACFGISICAQFYLHFFEHRSHEKSKGKVVRPCARHGGKWKGCVPPLVLNLSDRDTWSASRSGRFTVGKIASPYTDELRGRSGRLGENCPDVAGNQTPIPRSSSP